MSGLRPQAIETRDLRRVIEQVTRLLIWLGMLEMAALGRAPWGFLTRRERRGWLNEVETACDEVEQVLRMTRIAARTAVEEDAA